MRRERISRGVISSLHRSSAHCARRGFSHPLGAIKNIAATENVNFGVPVTVGARARSSAFCISLHLLTIFHRANERRDVEAYIVR